MGRAIVPPVAFPSGTLASLAPEFGLLCLAVRRAQQDKDIPALRALLGGDRDWNAVVAGARRHRAVPLVLAGLQAADGSRLQPALIAALRAEAAANGRRCLGLASETVRLVRLLAAAGIRVLVLKGVVLSQQLYGNLALRGAGDIDLLVDPQQFWDAGAVLMTAGYHPLHGAIPTTRRAAGQQLLRDLAYVDKRNGMLVELHQRLTANPSRLEAEFASLWRDRVEVPLAGTPLPTLPHGVLPLYLCVHGAHHCWERLCWLADLAALLKDRDRAESALADADAAGLGRAMRLAMTLGHDWLGLPLAGVSSADVRSDRHTGRFVTHFFSGTRWLVTPPRGSGPWLYREAWRRIYVYSLKKNWRHAWAELRADLVNPVDWTMFPLPGRLIWLYPFLRPVGWVMRNLCQRKPRERRGDDDRN